MTTTMLGLDGKIYIDTDATHAAESTTAGAPGAGITFNELDLTETVGHEDSAAQATFRNRRNRIARTSGGTREITYTVTGTYDASDATLIALRDAYDAQTTFAVAVMDGDITISGERGFFADMECVEFTTPQDEIDGFVSFNAILKPSGKSTFDPIRAEIT